MTGYVRYQASEVDEHGRCLGVFALVNALAKQKRLTSGQECFRRATNEWYDAAYPEPAAVDPTVYDRTVNPGAAAWFRADAADLLAPIEGYLSILADHGIAWERLEASVPPGRVVNEDEYQVVVVPNRDDSRARYGSRP